MSELGDVITEAVERSQEEGEGHEHEHGGEGRAGGAPPPKRMSLNSLVAVSVAVTATFVALCNVKDGNIVQAMEQAEANRVDAWAYYQAKGTKLNLAESSLDALKVEREITPSLSAEARALLDRKIADYQQKMAHYEQEKADIKKTADGFQQEYDRLNVHDDQFDMAEATISIAIALLGITALTQKRRLLYLAWGFAGFGVVLGVAGFLGLSLHPDFLAKLLG
jgi:hypothetical protein